MQQEKEYEGPERRYPRWWDKWVNPTTMFALLGGVVWGIQLNAAVVNHSAQIGAITARVDGHQASLYKQAKTLDRSAVILDSVEARLRDTTMLIAEHSKVANEMHREVIANKIKIQALHERK